MIELLFVYCGYHQSFFVLLTRTQSIHIGKAFTQWLNCTVSVANYNTLRGTKFSIGFHSLHFCSHWCFTQTIRKNFSLPNSLLNEENVARAKCSGRSAF